MPTMTKHGKSRMKERHSIPKKAVDKNLETALKEGVEERDCTGRLKKYVDYLYLSHQNKGSKIRLYSGMVYIFSCDTLVTVFPIPARYRDAAIKIYKRKKASKEEAS